MQIPSFNLPTDNIYKFMTVLGFLLIISSTFCVFIGIDYTMRGMNKVVEDIMSPKISLPVNLNESMIVDKIFINKSQSLYNAYYEYQATNIRMYGEILKSILFFSKIGFYSGWILFCLGFYLWFADEYNKHKNQKK